MEKKKQVKKVSQKKAEKQPEKPIKPATPKIVEIDADGKVLGRLATEIAVMLRGKNKPSFVPNLAMGEKVIVKNAKKIKITGKKLEQKIYYRHTGYLGHLKSVQLKELFDRNPSEVLKKAVYGMLPKNKLRRKWMKNLEIQN